MVAIHHPWVFTFGLLGNIISFMVFLAPVPTFIRIYKKKSTEGFHSVPYVIAIFSCMLWIYYALLKGNNILLITINTAGIVIETIYIAIFITYAPKQAKISTLKLLLLLNFCGFCAIVLLCHYLVKGDARVEVFGWICVAFSISVFAAPLSIMMKVIRTKSVEYMPFNLSLCLTLTAVIWFTYGMLKKDRYITLPNVGGFIFGVAQMILYGIYRKYDKEAQKQKLPEQLQISSSAKQSSVEIHPINSPLSGAITPTSQAAPEEIEVVVGIPENEEGKIVNEDLLHRPPVGPPCNVDAQKIVGGHGPAPAQLVECAV
uniref:Bidirectional sugar transporter SWEET n=2 Tax=Opuntia streptacantha TaxID=393608 RepID=A0A7C8YTT4_OPUST